MKTLHLQVFSGLGSRMRAVIGAIAWCKHNSARLVVHWPVKDRSETSGLFPIKFAELFVSDWIEDVAIEYTTIDAKNWPPSPKEYGTDNWRCRSCDPAGIVTDSMDLSEWPFLEDWKPSKFVQAYIDSVDIPDGCVGVHIRHALAQPATQTVDWFINRMREIRESDKNVVFFLSCDSLVVEKEVLSWFPSSIHVRKDYNYDRNGIAKAAADLFLLAKCDRMIGSYNSSFSELAGWMRGGAYLPGWGRVGWLPGANYEDSHTPYEVNDELS